MKKLLQNQKKNKFVLCVLLLALLASLALMTGCGNNDAQDGDADADGQDTAKETLVVGLDDTFAPMGFRDEQGNLVQREGEFPLEGEKEQRGKEVDDRLDDVPGKAGPQSSLIAVSHKDSPPI